MDAQPNMGSGVWATIFSYWGLSRGPAGVALRSTKLHFVEFIEEINNVINSTISNTLFIPNYNKMFDFFT